MAQYWALESEYFPRPFQPRVYEQRYQDFKRLAYELAARPGEALAVRWEDVDFEAGVVTISGTIIDTELRSTRSKASWKSSSSLTTRSCSREVGRTSATTTLCVSPAVHEDAGIHADASGRPECLAMLRRRKLAAIPGHRLIIPSRTGNVVRSEQMSKTWKSIVKGSGLEWSAVKTHRSTRATRVAEAYGLPAARLMLGHEENSPITAKHYVLEERAVVDFADAR